MHRKATAPSPNRNIDICGTNVKFPFTPYDAQLIYMEKIMQSLNTKKNAILESPTGTGKTLCLLCATLAWRELMLQKGTKKELVPRIIYSSRTHSQLKQVVQELKSTSYEPRVAILGSREQLCVEESVSKLHGTKQNLACRSRVKTQTYYQKCRYKRKFDKVSRNMNEISLPILDIEELVTTQKEKLICPFYTSRHMSTTADILFVPYNYLLYPVARSSVGVSLENAILIFDEAHNVESVASEASSYSFSSHDITGCVAELDKFIIAFRKGHIEVEQDYSVTAESVQKLIEFFVELGKSFNSIPLSNEGGCTKPGCFIFQFFEAFNLNFKTCPQILKLMEEIIESSQQTENEASNACPKLQMFMDFLVTVFNDEDNHIKTSEHYRVHIQETKLSQHKLPRAFFSNGNASGSTIRVFNYWCFHPGVAFRAIVSQKLHNIILTSGTLSPLATTIRELGIDFPIQLENNHVIDASQVWIRTLRSGVTGKRLNSSYKTRTSPDYLTELGNTIVNLVRLTPNGMLVFFPSYTILDEAISSWRSSSNGIWNRIANLKEVLVEPRDRHQFKVVVDEYHEAVRNNPRGAVFFAVCRGKVSEGIDFSDQKGRMVIITGLPFPPTRDPKIMIKKSILDDSITRPGETKLTGNQWYIQQATRAVNQAIGRVIRHRQDYGAIVLCDERFCLQQQQNGISKWLQPFCNPCKNYGDAHMSLTKFFKQNDFSSQTTEAAVLRKRKQVPHETEELNLQSGLDLLKESMNSPSNSQISCSTNKDGQTYVDPELLKEHLKDSEDTAPRPRPYRPVRSKQVPSSTSGMLHSIVASSRPVTNSTSSVHLAFKPPRQQRAATEEVIISNRQAQSSRISDVTDLYKRSADATFLDQLHQFPAAIRKFLSESQTEKLFALMKKLSNATNLDLVFQEIWTLIQGPSQREILDTLSVVLSERIRASFAKFAASMQTEYQNESLHQSHRNNSSDHESNEVGSLFSRLGYNKKSKSRPKAIIKRPQCLVCLNVLDNTVLKPFASTCGHICCNKCWKKMVSNGYVTCPICKLPIKLKQLRLLHAAEDRVFEVPQTNKESIVTMEDL